jgi:hypothetical protein
VYVTFPNPTPFALQQYKLISMCGEQLQQMEAAVHQAQNEHLEMEARGSTSTS